MSCPTTTLAPAATTTCSATYTVTQTDIDAGTILNTATASGTPPTGAAVTGQDTVTVAATSSPSITVAKSATPNNVTTAGQTVTYSFLVTNTGNVTLSGVAVSDPLAGLSAVSCPVIVLAPAAFTTCSATYVVSQADVNGGAIYNTATVSGTPPTGAAVTSTASATVPARATPSLSLQKSASPTTVAAAGDVVTYSFVATNTGNVTLTGVAVSDPLPGISAVSCVLNVLAPAESTTCSATYAVTQADVDAGSILNTATVAGTPPVGAAVTAIAAETVLASSGPAITLVKSALPATVTAAGQTITYSFSVTNNGNVTLSSVTVSDPLPGLSAITCPTSTLAPAASITCSASYAVTQGDIDGGAVNNTATVSGTPPTGAAVTATDTATVTAPASPSISLAKAASPMTVTAAGQTISYSFAVTNTGNVTLTGVAVDDPLPGLSAVTCPVNVLAPSAQTTCAATYTLTQADMDAGTVTNTATGSGTPPTGAAVSGQDTVTVSVTATPSISLAKSASPNNVTAAGQTINYSFDVTNTGNVTLSSVDVTDPLPGLSAISCPLATLAPAQTTTCSATYVTTQADLDAGSISNTATTTGTPAGSATAVNDLDSETVTAIAGPAIQITKSATPTVVTAAGETITYAFDVLNTGNVTLSSVVVSDPLPGLSAVTCPLAVLAPSETMTCSATYTVSQADIDAGVVNNTATVTGTPPGAGSPVSDVDAETVTALANPVMTLTKSAAPSTVSNAGETLTYSFLVTNTGNVTLSSVAINDPLPGLSAVTCPVTMLAPAEATTCTARYVVTQADVDAGVINNTATVSATPPGGASSVSDVDSTAVTAAPTPSVTLAKTADTPTVTSAGQSVTYTFVVTNTGNVTLSSVAVTDPLAGLSVVSCPAGTLAPAEVTTCSATYLTTQADIDAGVINNNATVTGTPPGGGTPVTATDSEVVAAPAAPSVTLVKSSNPSSVGVAGATITYHFVITNSGNVTLSAVGVTDPLPGLSSVSCPVLTLAPAESTDCSATYVVTQADIDAGVINNTATANATPPTGSPVSATDSHTVIATPGPFIDLVKSANPSTVSAADETITYSFQVTNVGNVTLTAIAIVDPLAGLSTPTCPQSTLDPLATMTCSATYVVTQADVDAGSIANTATVSGTPPIGSPVSDVDSVTVTATSSPSLTVGKTVDQATVAAAGETITYSFEVTNTGNVTLSGVSVSDPLPGLSAMSCPSTTLAPGATVTCAATYVVTQADVDAGSIANTATVSGTPPIGSPVSDVDSVTVTVTSSPSLTLTKTANPNAVGLAGQTITYTFDVTNTGNVSLTAIDIGDPLAGLSAVSCPATTLAPAATVSCSATYVVTQADVDAGSISNTATAVGTPPGGSGPLSATDTETVSVVNGPFVQIQKAADVTSVDAARDPISYTFVVTNTGNVTLTSITVVDPLPGLSVITCPASTLSPAETTTCSATYTATQADIDAGVINNTATVSGVPPTGAAVSDADSVTVTATPRPSVTVDKTADVTTISNAGDRVGYQFVVTNTGNVTLSSIAINDPLPGLSPVTCAVSVLAPAATTTCSASYLATQANIDAGAVANTATVRATPPTGSLVSGTDAVTVVATSSPSISMLKSATPSTATNAGTDISYSFVVTNTGNVTLSAMSISDPLPGLSGLSCPTNTLAPRQVVTCTATYALTQANVDAGSVINTATVTATPPGGAPTVNASGIATVNITPSPTISLLKTVTPSSVSAVGDLLTFNFLATNTGNVSLTNVIVSDPFPLLSAVSCPGFAGTLRPGDSVNCVATYRVVQADLDAGSIRNRASVVGSSSVSDTQVVGSGAVVVNTVNDPQLSLTKTASATVVSSGQNVTYTIVASNTGNVGLTNVVISDPLPGLSALDCGAFAGTIAPGQAVTCTATLIASSAAANGEMLTNMATAVANTPNGVVIERTASVVVEIRNTRIPTTGGDILWNCLIAISLILAGTTLLVGSRRKLAR